MTPSISVTLVNQLSEVERLSRLVEAFGEAEGLGPEAVFSLTSHSTRSSRTSFDMRTTTMAGSIQSSCGWRSNRTC